MDKLDRSICNGTKITTDFGSVDIVCKNTGKPCNHCELWPFEEEPSCLNQKKYRIEAEKALKNRIFDTKRMLGESINLRYLEKLQEMDLEELVRESLMVTKILDSYYE